MGGGKQLNVRLYSLLHKIAGHKRQIWLPKKQPQKQRLFYLFIYAFIYAFIYLFEIVSECKSRPKFHKLSLFQSKGSVLLAVFRMGIKLFTAISTRKTQTNSKIGSLLLRYGCCTHSGFSAAHVSAAKPAMEAQSHLASAMFKT